MGITPHADNSGITLLLEGGNTQTGIAGSEGW